MANLKKRVMIICWILCVLCLVAFVKRGIAENLWDVDTDNRISLPDILFGLQVLSGSSADEDKDGYSIFQRDCDDTDPDIHPGASEICEDGIDQDCSGSDLGCSLPDDMDNDGDGFNEEQGDCNDQDNTVYPHALEVFDDGLDQNCDGQDFRAEYDPVPMGQYDYSHVKSLVSDNILTMENVIINDVRYLINYSIGNKIKPLDIIELRTYEIPRKAISIDGDHTDWWIWHPDFPPNPKPGEGWVEYVIPYLYEEQSSYDLSGRGVRGSDLEGDMDPNDGALTCDIRDVFFARDDSFLYVAFNLYGNQPDRETLYTLELQRFFSKYHEPGDTIVHCMDGIISIRHRESTCFYGNYDSSRYVGFGNSQDFELSLIGFIEFKVPISDLEYDDDSSGNPVGIDNRFIRLYAHHSREPDFPENTYDGALESNRKMIINFYQ